MARQLFELLCVLLVPLLCYLLYLILYAVIYITKHCLEGQKTHSPARRVYVGRSPVSQETPEPTIYVSPANLPPPPKYELMAPPSYEEVVGTNYPSSANQDQPISQPITFAVALQNTDIAPVHTPPSYQTAIQINATENTGLNNVKNNEHVTIVTVTNERRSSAPVVT